MLELSSIEVAPVKQYISVNHKEPSIPLLNHTACRVKVSLGCCCRDLLVLGGSELSGGSTAAVREERTQ